MFPIKDSNIDFDNWIDTLDFKNILSLLESSEKNNYLDNGIYNYLKYKIKNSEKIKKYYDDIDKKNKPPIIFDDNDDINNAEQTIYNSNNKITNKRFKYAFTGNCGGSQCEFRFNGCSHLP